MTTSSEMSVPMRIGENGESQARTAADDAEVAAAKATHEAHDPHLAHHFETPSQQFEAAKFGMWLFIATEFLLFGGLFCLYAVFRHTKPELFAYGSQFLDTRLGMINTLVLIMSSLTMALAVYAAQRNRRRLLVWCLGLTVLGGAGFMGIKYIEYSHKFHSGLVWGVAFYEDPHEATALASGDGESFEPVAVAPVIGDAEKGRMLWDATCRTCHGVKGEGIAGQGKNMYGSTFIAERDDKQLVAFIKVGRMPFDPLNTTGIQMPPKGGNPMLKDEDLLHIVAYIRTFEDAPAVAAGEGGQDAEAGGAGAEPGERSFAAQQEFFIPKSSMPNAPGGPQGLVNDWERPRTSFFVQHASNHAVDPRRDPDRPENLHLFFGIYFLMTGLHGLHVLVGMAIIGWLGVRAMLGHFSSAYFTPVDLTGLYWHVVDIIWIFLFPLLYLIH